MIGLRFGDLVVLERDGTASGRAPLWKCQCDCGKQKSVRGNHLRSGASNSCGCRVSKATTARVHTNICVDLDNEEWRLSYLDNLEVSSLGRVRHRNTRHVFAARIDTEGYIRIRYGKKGHRVHRLAATAFLPKKNPNDVVNHIDGIKSNNLVSNLEWCSQRENVVHAFAVGLSKSPHGEDSGAAKLTEADIIRIRSLCYLGLCQAEIGEAFAVSQRTISLISRNETWTHV